MPKPIRQRRLQRRRRTGCDQCELLRFCLAALAAALREGAVDGELRVIGRTMEARIDWCVRLLAPLARRSPAIRRVVQQLRLERTDAVWDRPQRAREAARELKALARRLRCH
jgi:hypothetical protein